MQAEHITDAIKLAPPAVVTVSSLAGVRWDTLSYVLASVYTALLICHFVWARIIKPWRDSRASGQP